jgi:hypothetical protein
MNKDNFNHRSHDFFKFLGLVGLFSLFSLNPIWANPKFANVFYYVGQMTFDPGVSINEISDGEDFIIFKGQAPNKVSAYLLAEKLYTSRMQQEFKFSDIVPFWEKQGFTFILKKQKTKNEQLPLEIKSPLTRNSLNDNFSLEGSCAKEGAEINLSGDFQGKTTCKKGSWVIDLSAKDIKLPLVGVKVSQGLRGQLSEDFRSFLIRKP